MSLGAGAFEAMVGHLQDLIRIPTVNPPGGETAAATYLAGVLAEAGLEPEVVEGHPGRGNVVARLHGDGSSGGPLLLLSHLDVVPVEVERWSQDPFGGAIVDGYVYGRGAVDMKGTLAMQLAVVLGLAADARASGHDPARDPIPGLRRDVILAATADEESGGLEGIGWIVDERPELLRAEACLTETGGMSLELAGARFYPLGVAEKGFHRLRFTVHGHGGHGSVPRDDNAAVLAARIVERLAQPLPRSVTPLMARALERIAAERPALAGPIATILGPDEAASRAAIERLCRPPEARALRALLRDSISPTIVRSGFKDNVIPATAEIVIDVRQVPGHDRQAVLDAVQAQLGPELWVCCAVEELIHAQPLEQPQDHPLLAVLADALRRADPEAIPLPIMAPFATDAKHTVRLGIPTFGFSPLRLDPDEPFLERFHGDDERVSLDALRFGLPILDQVVRTYCG
ncbi:MAG TPA: M20/M25/M40 family metallo-hydrolase [Candidatus Limnocylindrales bacterium]|nr:M20/M25/M40 family metallo-hydrolase [Candidatus Limnocylindrales bacterium]